VFHTPTVLSTLRDLRETLNRHIGRVASCIDDHLHRHVKGCLVMTSYEPLVEMLIFDEAERLSVTALEFIRDLFDPYRCRRHSDWHAGYGKAPVPLSAAVQQSWLCSSLPALAGR